MVGIYIVFGLILTIVGLILSGMGIYYSRIQTRKGAPLFFLGVMTTIVGLLMLFFNVLGVGKWF